MTPNVPRQPELDFNKLRKALQDRIAALESCYVVNTIAVSELKSVLDKLISGEFDATSQEARKETPIL